MDEADGGADEHGGRTTVREGMGRSCFRRRRRDVSAAPVANHCHHWHIVANSDLISLSFLRKNQWLSASGSQIVHRFRRPCR